MLTNDFHTDRHLLDYLRIATFDMIQFYKFVALVERHYDDWRPAKWLQYSGRKSGSGIFHGIGDQAGRAHGVINVTGYQAALFHQWMEDLPERLYSTFYSTRLDIQVTKKRLDKEYRPGAYKRLKGTKSIIQSDTGITLYIGARTSDTFWRLYDKTDDLMRVEVEIKGSLAKRAYAALRNGESLDNLWNRFLLRSRVPAVYVKEYRSDGSQSELPLEDENIDLQPKLAWLATLDNLVYKLCNDHDTAEKAGKIVTRWAEYAQKFDRGDGDKLQ